MHERLAQLVQPCSVIRHAHAAHHAVVIHGQQGVQITVLRIITLHQCRHYTLKIVKRVMVSHKILATFIVHRLHDELGDLRSIGCFGRLYPYHNHEVICLQI